MEIVKSTTILLQTQTMTVELYIGKLKTIKENHRQISNRMNQELASRTEGLEKLKKNLADTDRQNEEQLHQIRVSQAQKAAEIEKKRTAEIAQLNNSSEAERLRATQLHEKRAAELKKLNDEMMKKALAEREEEKKKGDAAYLKLAAEREELEKRRAEELKEHRKELDRMNAEHQKGVDEQFAKLNEEVEKQILAEIDRIASETDRKVAILDAAHERMKIDAIGAMYHNFFKEYMSVMNRSKNVENAIEGIVEVLDVREMIKSADESSTPHVVPFELRQLHSEFLTESSLMERQIKTIRQRLQTCFNISDEFKEQLLQPFEPYENSCANIRSTAVKITMAANKNDFRALAPIHAQFTEHLKVLQTTIRDMNAIEYQRHVDSSLDMAVQKSIQQ